MVRKKMIKKLTLVLSMLMIGSALFTGCGGKDNSAASSGGQTSKDDKYGGTITLALSAIAKSIDPAKYTGVYEGDIIANIADGLLDYNTELTELVPKLAKEWSASEDGKVYTFKLRDDAYFQKGKFQDGRKMVAEDVKYSLERSAKESALNRLGCLDRVEVVNDTEVKCYLKQPDASFLTLLTDAGNVIVPKEEVEGHGDKFGTNLVGTGPFSLVEWKNDSYAKLQRHDKYWGEKPYLEGVTFKFVKDQNMMVNALKTNEIQIATDVAGEGIKLIKDDKNLKLEQVPGLHVGYIYMNQVNGPTKDKKVREAIYKAIDIDQLVKGTYLYDEAIRSYLPLPRGSWAYDKELEKLIPAYDPEGAKKLLAEAGYPDGFKAELYLSGSGTGTKVATIAQQYLKENLNIDLSIKTSEWGTFSEIGAKGQAPFYLMSWTWYPDPFFFLNKMFHSSEIGSLGNGQGYNNPEVDKLLDNALLVTDQEERAKLYKEATKKIVEDLPGIWYASSNVNFGFSNKVKDFPVRADKKKVFVGPGFNTYLEK